jgi:UDP-glucose 4-epimerase
MTLRKSPETWLLIGGAGFIGSHVAKLLSEFGVTVHVLDNLSTGIRSRVESFTNLHVGDARDPNLIIKLCREFEVYGIINLAAFMQARESVRDPIKYWTNNFGVSLALVEAIKSLDLRKVILSSSCSVYGNLVNATEDSALNPLSPYALTKVASEQILEQACREKKIEFVSLRYFNVIGGGDYPNSIDTKPETLIPSVCRKVFEGRNPIIFGKTLLTKDGTCERDYIDVRDLSDAHLKVCLHKQKFANAYINVSTGNAVSVKEIVEKILEISGKNLEIIYENAKPGDPEKVSAVPSHELLDLGWVPKYSLIDSISSHWAAFLKDQ